MTTQEERESIEILPPLESEKNLPSQIHEIDERIQWLNDELANIGQQIAESKIVRESMIRRAKEVKITDDGRWVITDIPVFDKKRVDVTILKDISPYTYTRVIKNIQDKIQEDADSKKQKAETFISQADLKAVTKDKDVLSKVIVTPKEPLRIETVVVKKEQKDGS
jgi:hypothetical protein